MSEYARYNQETREPTLEDKLLAMPAHERQKLLQDALTKYNEMEVLIHAITKIDGDAEQDSLF